MKRKLFQFFLAGILLLFFAGCDDSPSQPGEGFYSYQGFRDWWRIPLRYPYQIRIIDSFESGTLEKYDPASLIADPRCETLAEKVVEAGYHGKFAVFRQKNKEKPYGILIYASGAIKNFSTEEDLKKFAGSNYPDAAFPKMMDLDGFYKLMWQAISSIKKSHPGFFEKLQKKQEKRGTASQPQRKL